MGRELQSITLNLAPMDLQANFLAMDISKILKSKKVGLNDAM